ncbi:hypothetical protein PVAP13_3KG097627 [Panicum virgatum]|uniref:Uncharacterized protein n=1 Tax=Panicum virgatum TaxID=38727 RepID=A0A8T0UPR1_PANVG|nr:hypothetical protein PVAP13_3KG097627 [Panicum virgatum]
MVLCGGNQFSSKTLKGKEAINRIPIPLTWFCHLLTVHHRLRKGVGSLVLLVLWSLWRERNNRIFRKEELSTPRFISLLRDELRMWIFAGAKHSLVGHIFGE